MDQSQRTSSPASQPTEAPLLPEAAGQHAPSLHQQQPSTATVNSASTIPSSSSAPPLSPSPSPNPNPNPNHTQPPKASQSIARAPVAATGSFSRPWQQHGGFSHFSSSHLPTTSSPLLSSSSASVSSSLSSGPQRGGISLGVPASPRPNPSPSQAQPSSFSGSFGHHYGGLGPGGAGLSESTSNSNVSHARPIQGMQGMGMIGTLGSSSQMRPSGISGQQHQQRPVQSSLRPSSSPTSQSSATQNFQGHSLMRATPVGSPSTPPTSTSQSMQSLNQPWLSASGSQGRPPLPPSSYRPQMNTSSIQQRSHIPQQQHPSLPATTNSLPQQQQSLPQNQPQEQQVHALRSQQPLSHQQQITRVQASANQKPTSLVTTTQSSNIQSVSQNKTVGVESDDVGDHILGKRSIHELLNQIDPSEKLDPEVEGILVDIAEDFVDSITTFGCSLAKHRKSDTLEVKDILLHVERNWNMRPPGFSSDEIKTYRKPLITDIHKERLTAIKKSIVAEVSTSKNPVGQAALNTKGGLGKAPANNPLASPNFSR